jgi:hypothetical protein
VDQLPQSMSPVADCVAHAPWFVVVWLMPFAIRRAPAPL